MKTELIEADHPAWTGALDRVAHDFHHLPGYVALAADHEGGVARALLVDDGPRGMLLPLVIRPIPGSTADASSPYGYPGPLVWGTSEPDFVRAAFAAGIELLRSERIVSLFVRLHPLLDAVPPVEVGTLVTHGETVSIDLTQSPDRLWAQTRTNHRRDIQKAIRLGYVAHIDHRWEHFETFVRLYCETMERLSADERYMFDETYFKGLRAALGPSLSLWLVTRGDSVAAAVLFVETSGIVQYHLAGTDERYASARPTKLLIHAVTEWARDRGDSRLHLGGGVGAAYDSLMHFKAGFSDERHVFHTLRIVVDEVEYARLRRGPDRPVRLLPALSAALTRQVGLAWHPGRLGRGANRGFHIRLLSSDGPSLGSGGSRRPAASRAGRSMSAIPCAAVASVRPRTWVTVRARMRTSSPRLQWSTYQTSCSKRSSKLADCRPCTTAQPVMPGRISWRRASSGV